MTINQMQIFQAVCREGSITKAANKLFMAQPAVSNAIKEIEKSFDHPLFIRQQRRLTLTGYGHEILNNIDRILQLYNSMMKNGVPNDPKSIRIGTGTFLGKLYFPKIIKEYNKLYPDIKFEMYVESQTFVNRFLMDGDIDFSIMEYLNLDKSIIHYPLVKTNIIGICHSSHPLANQKDVPPEEIVKYPILMREQNSDSSIAIFDYFINRNIIIHPVWRSISITAITNAVKEDLGIAFISQLNYATYRCPELSSFTIKDFVSSSYINLYSRNDMQFTEEMHEFIEYFRKALRDTVYF